MAPRKRTTDNPIILFSEIKPSDFGDYLKDAVDSATVSRPFNFSNSMEIERYAEGNEGLGEKGEGTFCGGYRNNMNGSWSFY